MIKENHALRNENTALRRATRSQEDMIKDLSRGKETLLELVAELNETINKQKTQLIEFEEANTTLRQTLDNLRVNMQAQSEESEAFKSYSSSLERQLQAFQRASEQLSLERGQLEEKYSSLRGDYAIMREDMQIILGKVNQTMNTIKIMARRARGFAEWARDLRENTSPMASNAEELFEFLGMIRRDLGYFGHFH